LPVRLLSRWLDGNGCSTWVEIQSISYSIKKNLRGKKRKRSEKKTQGESHQAGSGYLKWRLRESIDVGTDRGGGSTCKKPEKMRLKKALQRVLIDFLKKNDASGWGWVNVEDSRRERHGKSLSLSSKD